jgi:hypothetical protein
MDRGLTSEIRGAVTMALGTNGGSRWVWAGKYATHDSVLRVGECNCRRKALVGHDWRGWRLVEACSFPIGGEPVVLATRHNGVVASISMASGYDTIIEMMITGEEHHMEVATEMCDCLSLVVARA